MPFQTGYDYTGFLMFGAVMLLGCGFLIYLVFHYSPIPPYQNMVGWTDPKHKKERGIEQTWWDKFLWGDSNKK